MAAILNSDDKSIAVTTVTNNTYVAIIGNMVIKSLPDNFKIKLFDEMKISEDDFMASVGQLVLEIMPYEEFVKRAEALKGRVEDNSEPQNPYDENSQPVDSDEANDVLYIAGMVMGAVNEQLRTFFAEVEQMPDTVQGLNGLTIKSEVPPALKQMLNKDEISNFTLDTMKAITADIKNDIVLKQEADEADKALVAKSNEDESEISSNFEDTGEEDDGTSMLDAAPDDGVSFVNDPEGTVEDENEPLDDTMPEPAVTPDATDVPTDLPTASEITPEPIEGTVATTPDDSSTEVGIAPEDEPLDDGTFIMEDNETPMVIDDGGEEDSDATGDEFGGEDGIASDDDFNMGPNDDEEFMNLGSDVPDIGEGVDATATDNVDDDYSTGEDDLEKLNTKAFQESKKVAMRRQTLYIATLEQASIDLFKTEMLKKSGYTTEKLYGENAMHSVISEQLKMYAEVTNSKDDLSKMSKEELEELLKRKVENVKNNNVAFNRELLVNKAEFSAKYSKDPKAAIDEAMKSNKGVWSAFILSLLDLAMFMAIITTIGHIFALGGIGAVGGAFGAYVLGAGLTSWLALGVGAIFTTATLGPIAGIFTLIMGPAYLGIFMMFGTAWALVAGLVKLVRYSRGINSAIDDAEELSKLIQDNPNLSAEAKKIILDKAVEGFNTAKAKGPDTTASKVASSYFMGKFQERLFRLSY